MNVISECYEKTFAHLPEKVLQFGEGNFLRAFVDWMIELSNRRGDFQGSVVLCQPIAKGNAGLLNGQHCQYTVLMRGLEKGEPTERVDRISSVSRCINPYEDYDALLSLAGSEELRVIVSNTTEAGIAYHPGDGPLDRPPVSFPAKLCAFLYARFQAFSGDPAKGLLILPVELIDNNGRELKKIVLRYAEEWKLGEAFSAWLETACAFASTLVDRIVTGYPRDQIDEIQEKLGYTDSALVTCELFHLWVIEADAKWAKVFPIADSGAQVIWTSDVTPYKKRKVRILNGAHTATVLAAYLAGHDTVLDCMGDEAFKGYMRALLLDEVVPTLDLPRAELTAFADSVLQRFENPFIRHRLLDISLNSCAKFCARCLPSLLAYRERFHALPPRLCFALAAFLRFYRGCFENGAYLGTRENGEQYAIRDDQAVLEFFEKAWQGGPEAAVTAALGNTAFWGGADLCAIPGLKENVTDCLLRMEKCGVRGAMAALFAKENFHE